MTEFKCSECELSLSSKTNLKAHMNQIHPTTPRGRFSCELCAKTFSENWVLTSHIATLHHGQHHYKCQDCPKAYTSASNLKKHANITHNGIRFTCHICKSTLSSKTYLEEHIQSIHYGIRPHNCSYCSKTFSSTSNLSAHIKRNHTITKNVFKCDLCDKTFNQQGYLSQHRKWHVSEKRVKCDYCNMLFYTNCAKKNHLRVHAPIIKQFKCHLCDKSFTANSSRKLHVNQVHNHHVNVVSCLFCEKVCKGKHDLFSHVRRHVQEQTHQCQLCSKLFYGNGEKNRHMKTHTGEKCYQCLQCGKRFTAKAGLQIHEQIHKNSFKYYCIFCEKGFHVKYYYYNHILSKIKEKPYSCHICNTGCVSVVALQAHMYCHKPGRYKCEYCEKVYKGQTDLKIHMQRWHPKQMNELNKSTQQ